MVPGRTCLPVPAILGGALPQPAGPHPATGPAPLGSGHQPPLSYYRERTWSRRGRAQRATTSSAASCPLPQALGTNHPLSDYQREDLVMLLAGTTRDDLIYGLKQCAKRGHALDNE